MKRITDYIDDYVFDGFDLLVLPHITIDYKKDNIHNKFFIIDEKYGIYDGLNELVEFIYKDIEEKVKLPVNKEGFQLSYNREDLTQFHNIFFSKLIIDCDFSYTTHLGGEYLDNESINKDTLLFDEVFINIYEDDINDIPEILKHELTHAYNNYQLLLKDKTDFYDKATSDFYKKIITVPSDEFKKYVHKVLYLTLQEEQNAFVAELSDTLRMNKKKIKNPKDALNVLKESNIYNVYKELYKHIQEYKNNELSQEYIDIITKEYNNISHTNLTPNKVFKKLDFLIKKSIKKFDIIVGKLCLENLNNIVTWGPTKLYINE